MVLDCYDKEIVRVMYREITPMRVNEIAKKSKRAKEVYEALDNESLLLIASGVFTILTCMEKSKNCNEADCAIFGTTFLSGLEVEGLITINIPKEKEEKEFNISSKRKEEIRKEIETIKKRIGL